MKVAVPTWQGRVSPVFDVARRLLVVEYQNGTERDRTETAITSTTLVDRAKDVSKLGVDVLVCGAISRPLEQLLIAEGVEVIPQTCGDVNEVLAAFQAGQLNRPAFVMPGCGRRRQMRRRLGRSRLDASWRKP